jgi:hypothetical protein
LFAHQAVAVEGLEWKWDSPRRFLLISDVNAPEYLLFQAEKNHQARVFKWRTNMVVSCVASPLGKKAAAVNCAIDDISLQAQSLPGDAQYLPEVLADLDSKLTGAVIQMEMKLDGRIRSVDLEGISKRHRRLGEIVETMRLVMARAVAVMDLQLPKKGDDGGKGFWGQKQSLVSSFPSSLGTLGSVRTQHELVEQKDNLVLINSAGKGVAGSGRTIEVAGQEQVANFYDMEYAGQSGFDLTDGSLTTREYQLRATPTASSEMGGAWKGMAYLQYAKLMRLDSEEQPNLGETRSLNAETKEAAP